MNYEEMSDFEINRSVLELAVKSGIVNNVAEIHELGFTSKVLFTNPVGDTCRWDGCNNPSDAWPIIVDNAIALLPNTEYFLNRETKKFKIEYQGGYVASVFPIMPDGFNGSEIAVINKNPLRAAMICFLKIKEAENA